VCVTEEYLNHQNDIVLGNCFPKERKTGELNKTMKITLLGVTNSNVLLSSMATMDNNYILYISKT
jgi:hypothetical protein